MIGALNSHALNSLLALNGSASLGLNTIVVEPLVDPDVLYQGELKTHVYPQHWTDPDLFTTGIFSSWFISADDPLQPRTVLASVDSTVQLLVADINVILTDLGVEFALPQVDPVFTLPPASDPLT